MHICRSAGILLLCCVYLSMSANADTAEDPTKTFNACNSITSTTETTPDNTQNNVQKINVVIQPVFDESIPEENNWAFRLVNTLHINTHLNVIKNDLQFKEGDKVDEKLLAESERLLRTRRYLNSASVTQSVDCHKQSTVNVAVREVWTLVPEVTYSHTGGKSNYGFGLHDSNFLGLGKTINITHSVSASRTSDLVEYYDPNTGFHDTTFSTQYSNNSDGKQKSIAFQKPFRALDTEWASGIDYESLNEEDTLFQAGKEFDRFARANTNHSLFYGIKFDTSSRDSVHRLSIGHTQWSDEFDSVGLAPNNSKIVPANRQYSYPWIEYQHIYDGYVEAQNIQQINRVEDINLGSQIRIKIGYTSSKYTENDKNLVFNTEFSQGFQLSQDQLVLAHITANGFDNGSHTYNSQVKTELSYHWQNFTRAQFYINAANTKGTHLFADLPLELGGDSGLRGYPIRYTAGEHLQLITVEQRYFGQKEWLSLFHVGAAVFYDQGRVFGAASVPQYQQQWLRDVGIGLRISGTRTGNMEEGAHNVLHIDVASPLDGSKDISKLQWLVKVKRSF